MGLESSVRHGRGAGPGIPAALRRVGAATLRWQAQGLSDSSIQAVAATVPYLLHDDHTCGGYLTGYAEYRELVCDDM
jgi:hypothetical protein